MRLAKQELATLVAAARDSREDLARSNAAFNRLVLAFQDYALGAAYGYLHDYSAAEDAAQESFLIAWRNLGALRDAALFPAWFKRIVLSQCNRILRKKRSAPEAALQETARAAFQPEALLTSRETQRLVAEALAALPLELSITVSLFYFAGEDHLSIARFLGLPRTTVVKRLHAARRKLKPLLEPLRLDIAARRPSQSARFAAMVRTGIYNDYVGLYRYRGRPELTVLVKRVGNRLVSFSNGQKNTALLGSRITELRIREFDGKARFMRNRAGKITHFVYYEFGKRMGTAWKTG